MPRGRAAAFVVLLAALTQLRSYAQSPPRSTDRQSFTSTATAILVDVVVRDKRGHPVIDLSAPDYQISDDGEPHKIDNAPPGRTPASITALTISCDSHAVEVAGFDNTGTPASKLTAAFSHRPHAGKL